MKYVVQIASWEPTEEYPDGDVVGRSGVAATMFDALKMIENAEINSTVFISVTITPTR